MTSIGWLHLADLHQTVRQRGWKEPHIQKEVHRDLAKLHERTGPWDLVIFGGDLSMRGAPEEFAEAERALDDLLDYLRTLGSDPCLLAVPGNHDLVRPRDPSTALRSLGRWHKDPDIREEFWNDPESPARRLIDRALEPFAHWWNGCMDRLPSARVKDVRRGLLPGDFTATIIKKGMRLGIAGLCSPFLQLTGDDYQGHLALDPLQLTVAAGGDIPAWIAKHDATVLVTHHGPEWLARESRERYETNVNPAGRFCAHLTAHLHGPERLVEEGERVQIRCASFFGLDGSANASRGEPLPRRHGYNVTRLELGETSGNLEIHSRIWDQNQLRLHGRGPTAIPITRFPRLSEKAPAFLLERASLRDEFAAAYRSPDDVHRLAHAAGVSMGEGPMAHAPIDAWHRIVSKASTKGLAKLVEIARQEHPANQRIVEKWAAYQRVMAPASALADAKLGSTEETLASELYARLVALHPSAFDAVLTTLSLKDKVPGSTAPQTTRAIAVIQQMERQGKPGLEKLGAVTLSVSGTQLPVQRPGYTQTGRVDPDLGWIALVGAAALGGIVLAALMASDEKKQRRPRRPTRASLSKLLGSMFYDERDFDGFVLDQFPAVYRRFHNGMDRPYRIRLLLDAIDTAEVVSRLNRAHPSAFRTHQRVLDYEDELESRPRVR